MKQLLLLLFTLFSLEISLGQTALEILKTINTYYDATELIAQKPFLHGEIIEINSNQDTSAIQKKLYTKNSGDIITVGKRAYKILHDTTVVFANVNYIYLDGRSLLKSQIDSIREYILSEYKKGTPFDSLKKEFNMDGSTGDTDWFPYGMMVSEFSNAVRKHKLSDVFIVDVPGNNWYYVVKKTLDSKIGKQMTVLSIEK